MKTKFQWRLTPASSALSVAAATKTLLRPAISLFVLLSVITGAIYPAAVTGVARVLFAEAAAGSLVVRDGKPVGSNLIGQNFTDPKYFWGRPSATSPYPYNGAASSGSNQGPLNPALVDAVKGRLEALKAADPDNKLADPGRSCDGIRQRPRPAHRPGRSRIPDRARRPRAQARSRHGACAGDQPNRGPPVRLVRRAAGQCAQAEPGSRPSASVRGATDTPRESP